MTWHAGSNHFRTYDFGPEPEPVFHGHPHLRRLWLVCKLMLLAGIIAGGIWLFQSPVFQVQAVTVQGLSHRTEREILERVSLAGQNVLTLPVAQIQSTLAEDPWLRSVEVQRQLPNRVTLHVQERKPAAVWDGKGGRYLADADGTLLDPAPAKSDLPIVKDIDGPVYIPGDRLGSDAAELAAKLVVALPQVIGQRAKSFEYLSNGGMVVEMDKGKRARLGDGTDFDYKLAVWKALLNRGDTEKLVVGHVDLRFGDRPFFRDK